MRFAALALVSVATTVVLLVPAVTGADGFPVSTHPMYATARPADASFISAEASTASGTTVELSMRQIADTDDPLVAEARLRRAARADDGRAQCERIASRVAATDAIETIRIVRIRAPLTDFVRTGRATATVDVLTTCRLP